MPGRFFRDRRDAGRVLATHLGRYRNRGDVIVLALPRGAVGYEVARALEVPLDVFLVRKLGVLDIDPVAAERARERYACFDHYDQDGQNYGLAAACMVGCRASPRWSSSSWRSSGSRQRRCGVPDCWPKTSTSMRAERAHGEGGRGLLPHDVWRSSLVLESPRHARGRNLDALAATW